MHVCNVKDGTPNVQMIIYSIYINGLVRKRRNSSALAMELRLSCTNPSIYAAKYTVLSSQ